MAAEDGARRRSAFLLVVPSALALVAVLGLIGALLGLFGEPAGEEFSAQPSVTSAGRLSVNSSPRSETSSPRSETSSPRPGTSSPPPDSATPTATGSPPAGTRLSTPGPLLPSPDPLASAATGSGSYSGSGKEWASGTTARPLPVYVLNQTTRTGLAAEVAEDIEAAGWSVTKVSWWRGRVPSTTVYYPPGYEGAAQALSNAFPAIDRIRPRVAPMPDDALTVILCKEYPEP